MKKLIYLFVAGTMFVFTACGGGETATEEAASDHADVIAAEQAASDAEDIEHAAPDTVAEEATEETTEETAE
jgi:PBP1b-binding outer membrane lipoprotein LpoB